MKRSKRKKSRRKSIRRKSRRRRYKKISIRKSRRRYKKRSIRKSRRRKSRRRYKKRSKRRSRRKYKKRSKRRFSVKSIDWRKNPSNILKKARIAWKLGEPLVLQPSAPVIPSAPIIEERAEVVVPLNQQAVPVLSPPKSMKRSQQEYHIQNVNPDNIKIPLHKSAVEILLAHEKRKFPTNLGIKAVPVNPTKNISTVSQKHRWTDPTYYQRKRERDKEIVRQTSPNRFSNIRELAKVAKEWKHEEEEKRRKKAGKIEKQLELDKKSRERERQLRGTSRYIVPAAHVELNEGENQAYENIRKMVRRGILPKKVLDNLEKKRLAKGLWVY